MGRLPPLPRFPLHSNNCTYFQFDTRWIFSEQFHNEFLGALVGLELCFLNGQANLRLSLSIACEGPLSCSTGKKEVLVVSLVEVSQLIDEPIYKFGIPSGKKCCPIIFIQCCRMTFEIENSSCPADGQGPIERSFVLIATRAVKARVASLER